MPWVERKWEQRIVKVGSREHWESRPGSGTTPQGGAFWKLDGVGPVDNKKHLQENNFKKFGTSMVCIRICAKLSKFLFPSIYVPFYWVLTLIV